MLGLLFPGRLPRGPARRAVQLAAEALACTLVSTWLPATLGLEEAGLVSLFLLAATLSDRLTMLLEENRTSIWDEDASGWRANGRTAWGILMLFSGVFAGHAIIAAAAGEARVSTLFGFALRTTTLTGETLAGRDFGSVLELLGHNLRVLLVVACLSFVYRAYGAMLALAWNASVWAVVLTTLSLRAPTVAAATSLPALIPHLLLEGFGYVCVSLAFLFASKGLATHPMGDPRLPRVLKACLLLLVAGCAALTLGACAEVWVAGAALSSH
jgi:hypothetical protein